MTRNFGLRHIEPESHLSRDTLFFIFGGLVGGVVMMFATMTWMMVT